MTDGQVGFAQLWNVVLRSKALVGRTKLFSMSRHIEATPMQPLSLYLLQKELGCGRLEVLLFRPASLQDTTGLQRHYASEKSKIEIRYLRMPIFIRYVTEVHGFCFSHPMILLYTQAMCYLGSRDGSRVFQSRRNGARKVVHFRYTCR